MKFDPTYGRSFNARDAYSFALACQLAYREEKQVQDTAGLWGFGSVHFFDIKRGGGIDTQGYIAADAERILVAFRGTAGLPDWLTNIQIAKDPGPEGHVHEGFQDAFFVSTLRIGSLLGGMKGDRDIWVTGHSLGGALATLLVATLIENGIDVKGLYTYGAPRVGDGEFAKWLNGKLRYRCNYRVVNEGDVVPHLPSEQRFSHAGVRRLLVKGVGAIEVDNKRSTWRRFARDAWSFIGGLGTILVKIKNPHTLEKGYLPRLARLP
ncbi:MAG: lipase family protein [Gammaproteobacteria bacterium]|nr:lipase family protein [Gammaproteobacteria bacterium]